jgi:hypothetical protein
MPRPEILRTIAEEEGTYIVDVSFLDEDDLPVTPVSINWTLTTLDGVIVNDRNKVDVAAPASTVALVLSGNDLKLLEHTTSFSWRLLTIKASYNSDLAPGLPLHGAVRFKVRNLRLVARDLNVSVFEGVIAGESITVTVA